MKNSSLSKAIKIAIVAVYVIFLAGSVVRMTGAGMGCPDWPKCFGYYIPPTNESQITWKPNTTFNKGAIVIHNKTLYVAKSKLQTGSQFSTSQWEKYTKHNYAVFNPAHTWTEYINRLSSVVAGFIFVWLLLVAFKKENQIKGTRLLVTLAFAGMLFEAWLGKTVVDSVLSPYIITLHMFAGLIIVALLIKALVLSNGRQLKATYLNTFYYLLISSLALITLQILLGTQVRQFVDEQIKQYGFHQKEFRLLDPNFNFYFHRSFTIVVVIVNACLIWMNRKYQLGFQQINWVGGLLFLEAFSGVLMYYVDFPFGTQAIHLLSGAISFGILLYLTIMMHSLKRIS